MWVDKKEDGERGGKIQLDERHRKMIQTKRDNDRDKDLGRKNIFRLKAHKKYEPKNRQR